MIFGESAGGLDVCALIASPGAAGLFQSALIESGGCVADTRTTALATGATLSGNAGCSGSADVSACLRSKTPAELLAALPPVVTVSGGQPPYQPNVDGSLLPDVPLEVIRSGEQRNRESGRAGPGRSHLFARGFRILTQGLRRPHLGLQVHLSFADDCACVDGDANRSCLPVLLHRGAGCTGDDPVRCLSRPRAPVRVRCAGHSRLRADGRRARAGDRYAAAEAAWTRYDPARDNHLVLESGAVRVAEGVNTARCDFWASLGL
jgi:Carboxylesterase family